MKYLYAALFAALALSAQPSAMARDSGRFIVNALSGKCIDVSGAPGTKNGAKLLLWECEFSGLNADNRSRTDQRWTLNPQGFIVNEESGKCLDVAGAPGTANGAALMLWDCETSGRVKNTDQKWELLRNGQIRNWLSGKCIDVSGNPGKTNGAKLQLWTCETSKTSDQYWKF
jgi:hypothetical protein